MTVTDALLEERMVEALRRLDLDEFEQIGSELAQRARQRRLRLAAPEALASAAAWYAAQGVPVFPVEERAKVPLVRWRDAASTEAPQIAAWWRRWPKANIGMPTGLRWDVIDIDGPPGYQSFGKLREAGRLPPMLGRTLTPRGGMHVFISPTGDGNAAGFVDSVDYRGLGGYVVLPPSFGANGRQYEWCEMPPVSPEVTG